MGKTGEGQQRDGSRRHGGTGSGKNTRKKEGKRVYAGACTPATAGQTEAPSVNGAVVSPDGGVAAASSHNVWTVSPLPAASVDAFSEHVRALAFCWFLPRVLKAAQEARVRNLRKSDRNLLLPV